MNTLAGKLLAFTVNGVRYRCQTEGSLSITANVSEEESCKPEATDLIGTGDWIKRSVDSRDWTMSFSAKTFADSVAGNQNNIADLMIAGTLEVEAEFLTTPGQHEFATDFVYTGPGILTNFTLDAPAEGSSTYDVEIQGNGPLVLTKVPVI